MHIYMNFVCDISIEIVVIILKFLTTDRSSQFSRKKTDRSSQTCLAVARSGLSLPEPRASRSWLGVASTAAWHSWVWPRLAVGGQALVAGWVWLEPPRLRPWLVRWWPGVARRC
jgi:hypothetical protein